jgi:hypothetical protein
VCLDDALDLFVREKAFRGYVQDVAASSLAPADQLSKFADLKARGVITDAEFEVQKAKILSTT